MSQSGPQASSTSPLTPSWLDHLAALGWRVLVTVALGVVVLWLATVLGTVTISILVAGIIAATFAPIAGWLRGRGWSRTKTAAVVTLGAILSITAVIVLIALAFVPYVPEVIAAIQAAVVKVQADLAASGASSTAIADAEQQLQTWLTTHISAIVGTIGTVVTVAILGGILLFFLLQDGDKAWVWTIQAASDWRRERITSSGDDALQRVGGYLRGTAVLAALHAATDLVFMFLLGVPLAAPLAVLVFFGGFIPYVGGFVTTIIVLLVAYSAVGPAGRDRPVHPHRDHERDPQQPRPAGRLRQDRPHPSRRSCSSRCRPVRRSPGSSGCSWPSRSWRSSRPWRARSSRSSSRSRPTRHCEPASCRVGSTGWPSGAGGCSSAPRSWGS